MGKEKTDSHFKITYLFIIKVVNLKFLFLIYFINKEI